MPPPPPRAASSAKAVAQTGDRDRFVAFSFCSADVLVELDKGFVVRFCAGAVEPLLGRKPEAINGQPLSNLAREEDRAAITALLRRCTGGDRLDDAPMVVAMPDGSAMRISASGYCSRKLDNHIFLALRRGNRREERARTFASAAGAAVAAASGEAELDAFSDVLEQRLEALLEEGAEVKMTMIDLGDTEALKERMDGRGWRRLQMQLADVAMAASVDGSAAGMLGDGRIGILQRGDADVSSVERTISNTVRKADPTGEGTKVAGTAMALDASSLSDAEAINALVYAVKQLSAAPTGEATDPKSLSVRMAETAQRIGATKDMIAAQDWDIAYQPIVGLSDNSLHHVEALVRFRKSAGDSPFQTIRFAEEVGLVCEFDMQICRDVIARLQRRVAEPAFAETGVAVNISGISLSNERFVNDLLALLRRSPDLRGRLLFEITESARVTNLDEANRVVQLFRAQGFKMCLDDFGVGESAFEYLRAFEVDYVKIDGSFIDLAMREEKGRAFIVSIAILCGTLGIATVAERIEDSRQIPFLRRCGVGYGQGYHFGKPTLQPLVGQATGPLLAVSGMLAQP